MNEYENGEILVSTEVLTYNSDSGDTTPSTTGAGASSQLSSEPTLLDRDLLQQLTSSVKNVYNYLFNFEALNIDNEIFYMSRLVDYYDSSKTPFITGGDGSQYLTKFKNIQTRNLNSNFITSEPSELDSNALTKEQMTIARHVHYLGDIKYGENEFSDRDDTSFSVYIPTMRRSGTEPTFAPRTNGPKATYSDDELSGLRQKFGGLSGSISSHINEKIQEMATEVFETYISRENIPNIIPNNNRLLGINDLTDEGGSAITITATSTATTTY